MMNSADPVMLSGFLAGLVHPVSVPAHVLALFGLGLMIGQQSRRRATLIAFALGLVAGLAALAAAVGETSAGTVVLAGAALAGLATAIGWPVRGILGAPLALMIGAGIGLGSPPRAVSIQAANAALVGTALSAFAIVAVIAALAALMGRGWLRVGVRVLGSWIAASAILVVALRLAR